MNITIYDHDCYLYEVYLNGHKVDATYADEEGHVVDMLLKDNEGKPIPAASGTAAPFVVRAEGEVLIRRVG